MKYCRVLADFNNDGRFYILTIATEDEKALFETLHLYSDDVRFVEYKNELAKADKGSRTLPDGSVIKSCKYFCDKNCIHKLDFNGARIIGKAVTV